MLLSFFLCTFLHSPVNNKDLPLPLPNSNGISHWASALMEVLCIPKRSLAPSGHGCGVEEILLSRVVWAVVVISWVWVVLEFEPGAFKILLKTWDHDFGQTITSHPISPHLTNLKTRLASSPASARVSTRLLHRTLQKTGALIGNRAVIGVNSVIRHWLKGD